MGARNLDTYSARSVFSENGIDELDDFAVSKIAELPKELQVHLANEFLATNNAEEIKAPSKWLFSKARTLLTEQARARKESGAEAEYVEGDIPLPELPHVYIDSMCNEKLEELDENERHELLKEYQQESLQQLISNPSRWLFSHARTKIVERRGKGGGDNKGKGKDNGAMSRSSSRGSLSGAIDVAALQGALADDVDIKKTAFALVWKNIGVDQACEEKIAELETEDQQTLLQAFVKLPKGEVKTPSAWLFSKARSMLSARGGGGTHVGHDLLSRTASSRNASPSGRGAPIRPVSDSGKGKGGKDKPDGAGRGKNSLAELPGVALDDVAYGKIMELTEEEKEDLLEEYHRQCQNEPVRNPSGWLFGRARTKVVERVNPKRAYARAAPY